MYINNYRCYGEDIQTPGDMIIIILAEILRVVIILSIIIIIF